MAAFFCLVAVVVRPFVGWWLDNGARRVVLVVGLVLLALASAIALALGLELMGFGFNVLYLAAAAISVLALVLFCFIRTPKPQVEKRPLSLKGLVNRDYLPATCTMLVFMFTFGALENFVAIYAVNEGLPSGSLYFVVMSVVLLLVRVFLGKMVDECDEAFFVYTGNVATVWAAASLECSSPRWGTATCGPSCLRPALRASCSTWHGLATAIRASPRRWRRLASRLRSGLFRF